MTLREIINSVLDFDFASIDYSSIFDAGFIIFGMVLFYIIFPLTIYNLFKARKPVPVIVGFIFLIAWLYGLTILRF